MMNEEKATVKKDKRILLCKICALAVLAPTLYFSVVLVGTYVDYLGGTGKAIVILPLYCMLVIPFYASFAIPSFICCIAGLKSARKYYKTAENQKGRRIDFAWFILILCILALTLLFAIYFIAFFGKAYGIESKALPNKN